VIKGCINCASLPICNLHRKKDQVGLAVESCWVHPVSEETRGILQLFFTCSQTKQHNPSFCKDFNASLTCVGCPYSTSPEQAYKALFELASSQLLQ